MEKDIRKYLHLYCGSWAKITAERDGNMSEWKEVDKTLILNTEIMNQALLGNVQLKLILRPIEDITDSEARENAWGSKKAFLEFLEFHKHETEILEKKSVGYRFFPDDMMFLLSKSFDLFDLIESDIATPMFRLL